MQRAEEALVRVADLSGRARGTAFHVDHQGLLLTGHEVVDGLQDLLLTWPGGATRRLGTDSLACLPEYGLALLHTDAVVPPLALAGGHGTRLVSLHLDGKVLQGGVAGVVTARYAARTRFHLVADAWLLHLEQAPHGLPVQAAGSPVLDAETGAVVAVATVALRGRHHGAVLAVPLRSAVGHRAVADLLARNGATVPAHGRALNLAGALELCAATLGPVGRTAADRAERADGLAAAEPGWARDPDRPVLALVGEPGSGRSTELAALALRRAGAAHRLPTVLLRGAELRAGDASVLDAADRVLEAAGRLIHVEGARTEQVCRVSVAACRPPLIVLDAPEEMPPALFDALETWCAESARMLRRTGARLLIGCRPEFWEQAGPLFPAEDLYGEGSPPGRWLGDLPAAAHGAQAGHPLTLRLLAELHAAAPRLPLEPEPGRARLLAARVDLACLRIAERIALRPSPAARPAAVRRLAAAVAGRVHEAARRMLGPGSGTLDRAGFDELFPWAGGWAQAVLAEGLLEPAGPGYRFAHEEVSDWLQGGRLDLGAALDALLGDGLPTGPDPGSDPRWDPGRRHPRAASGARGAHRRGGPRGQAVPAPAPAPGPPLPPVPRPLPHHRIGPVRAALLRLAGEDGDPTALEPWLSRLVLRLDGPDAAEPGSEPYWWTSRLLASVLSGLDDAGPYLPLLRTLAERMAHRAAETGEQPLPAALWSQLRLPVQELIDFQLLLSRAATDDELLVAVAPLVRRDPAAALPALCRRLRDERLAATVGQLLRAVRRIALDDLTEALVDTAHPRADALLRELAATESSALSRAVDRWAHDPRPERHVAAAVHAPAVRAESGADRTLLRYAAEALLARDGEQALHGAALAVLVADPATRDRHLPDAAARYAEDDPLLRPQDLAPGLDTHPALVLAAYAARLHRPGEEAGAILRTLGSVAAPRAQPGAVRLVGEHLDRRPEAAAQVADWLAARVGHGGSGRALLLPFVRTVAGRPEAVRTAFREALAAALGREPAGLGGELLAELRAEPRAGQPMRAGDQAHGRL